PAASSAQPAAPATPAGAPAAAQSHEAAAKLRELEAILASRNDNDPRLDKDFNALSPEAKRLFRRKYAELPREARNDLGTIVYLLGKNLKTEEDWAFLREVAAEPPCRSLSSCDQPSDGAGEPGDPVTLAYPALVALKQAGAVLDRPDASAADAANARSVIEA